MNVNEKIESPSDVLIEKFVQDDKQLKTILMFLEALKLSYEGGIEQVMPSEVNEAYNDFMTKITFAVTYTISERYKRKNLNSN